MPESLTAPLSVDRIESDPIVWLQQYGKVFARFDDGARDSGNITLGIEIDGNRFFVKTTAERIPEPSAVDHQTRVELLRNAVRLHESCRHPLLARLLNVIESRNGPVLVYEWVDGELLYSHSRTRDRVESPLRRFRALRATTIQRHVTSIYELHVDLEDRGWISGDFYDGCLIYDFDRDCLRVVDLDAYRRGPSRNDMGRMFGSTRFMAPEEFEIGAALDERTTVHVMGRTALVLLSNGTVDATCFRGPRALFEVAQRACASDPRQRFPTMRAFHDAWISACGTALEQESAAG